MTAHFEAHQRALLHHLRDPDAHAPPMPAERAAVYQSLVYTNIESLLRSGFPVLRAIDDDTRWHARVRAFIRDHRCDAAEFHRAAGCFVDFCYEHPQAAADDWPFLAELVHYEWVEMVLAIAPDRVDWTKTQPDEDWVLSPLAAVLAYCAPVHLLKPGLVPEISDQPATFLAVRRNRHDVVQFMQLNALTHQLLILARQSPGQGIDHAARALMEALPALTEPLAAQLPTLVQHLRDADILVPRATLQPTAAFADSDPHLRLPSLR